MCENYFQMQAILIRFKMVLWLHSNQRILYNCKNILELHIRVSFMSHVVKYVQDSFYLTRLNLIKYLVHEIRNSKFRKFRIF